MLIKPTVTTICESKAKIVDRLADPLMPILMLLTFLTLAATTPAEATTTTSRPVKRKAPAAKPALTPSANMNPLEHNNLGVEYGLRGDWPHAVAEHEAALNGDPENVQFKTNLSGALLRYGQTLTAKKDYRHAIHQLREALYVDPNNADASNLLDQCLKATGQDPSKHMKMGEDLEVEGNYPDAIAEFKRNLRSDDSGLAYAALGRALVKQGANSPNRLVEGYKQLTIAVGKTWDPSQTSELAACHQKLGDILKDEAFLAKSDGRRQVALIRLVNASSEYRKAVQLNPSNLDVIRNLVEVSREVVTIKPSFDNHLMLGSSYLLLGDFDRAKHEYEECDKLDHNNELLQKARKAYHWQVAASTQHLDLLPRTIAVAEDNLRRNPNDAEWLYIWGMAKQQQGDKDLAFKAYNKAAQINPALPKLKERMTALASANSPPGQETATKSTEPGDRAASQPATAGSANNQTINATQLAAIGEAESKFRNGDLAGALRDATNMTITDTSNGRAWMLIGTILEKQGNLDEASVAYRQAALLKVPGAADACRQLDSVRVHSLLDDADKQVAANNLVAAAATLKEAASLAPDLAIVHRKLGDVLEKLGDKKEAERERKKADQLEKEN